MLKTIKARCVNGALVPLEPIDLREGDEYLMTLDVLPAPLPPEGSRPGPSTPALGGNTMRTGSAYNVNFTNPAGLARVV